MSRNNDLEIRLAVGVADGPQSSVLRIWSRRGESNVYVAVREIGARLKISLHDGGECHAGLTSEFAKTEPEMVKALGGSRHQNRWKRQTHTGRRVETSLICAFPTSELSEWRDKPVEAPSLRWLSPPEVPGVTCVACLFTSSDTGPDSWPGRRAGYELIAFKHLPNGETFWVVTYRTTAAQRVYDVLSVARKRIETENPIVASSGPAGFPGRRLIAFDFDEEERTLVMIDASSPPDSTAL